MARHSRWALALVGLTAAGCAASAPGQHRVSSTDSPAATSASSNGPSVTTPASTSPSAFVPIVEPFDSGHPARAQSAPPAGGCSAMTSTVDIATCELDQAETTDARIDAVQRGRFDAASPAGAAAINADDRAWLAARGPICQAAYHSGGSIDQINIAGCIRAESATRLAVFTHSLPSPVTGTANWAGNDRQPSYVTLADGTRIGVTVSPDTSGLTVTFIVVAGYRGLALSAGQFGRVQGGQVVAGPAAGPPELAGTQLAPAGTASWAEHFPNGQAPADQFGYASGGHLLARLTLPAQH